MEFEYQYDSGISEDTARSNSVILSLSHAIKIVGNIFSEYAEDRDDLESQTRETTAFVRELLSQPIIPGDADDWHNLAVDVARQGYYNLACDILEVGLSVFPNNTDLLGDYLQYGTSCKRIDQCRQYYERLSRIPKVKYTWRGFHFSASWLSYLWEQCSSSEELQQLTNDLLALTAQYRKYFPDTEECYLCESDVYKLIKDRKKEIKTLSIPISRAMPAPKCALRLADYYFNAGDYQEAQNMVVRSLKYANQVQQAVNEAYLYYLYGLIQISLLSKPIDMNVILSIYDNFEKSLRLSIRSSLRDVICQKTGLLYQDYKIPLPEHCSKLLDLLDSRDMLS